MRHFGGIGVVRGFGAYAVPFGQGIGFNPLVDQHLFKCI